jgi:hypothetical protein
VVSVYSSVIGTQEIVPYKGIPNGLGENEDRVQDWIAHFFFAYFCAEGNKAFIPASGIWHVEQPQSKGPVYEAGMFTFFMDSFE